jgi:hypothetical protein
MTGREKSAMAAVITVRNLNERTQRIHEEQREVFS